jgi:hypothetical protein
VLSLGRPWSVPVSVIVGDEVPNSLVIYAPVRESPVSVSCVVSFTWVPSVAPSVPESESQLALSPLVSPSVPVSVSVTVRL